MANRLDLQTMLEELLESRNVYFQPPDSVSMGYPAIKYSVIDIHNLFANGTVYAQTQAYQLIVISDDPDSEIIDKVSKLPTSKFNRHYVSDNLNHNVFTIQY